MRQSGDRRDTDHGQRSASGTGYVARRRGRVGRQTSTRVTAGHSPDATFALMTSRRSVSKTSIAAVLGRSEEHTSELQSLMRISYAVFCLNKKTRNHTKNIRTKT